MKPRLRRGEIERIRRLDDIGDDRARRGILPRPASIEERLTHHIAPYGHGIEDAVHARQDVLLRHQRRMHPHLDPVARVRLDHREQFDPVAKEPRKPDITRRHLPRCLPRKSCPPESRSRTRAKRE